MNEILQKRIEEAVNFLFKQRGLDKESCRQAMYYILTNQWISVEEALPEKIEDKNYSKYVLTRQEYYEHEYYVIARYDYGFNMWVSTNYFKPEFITHWMPIPKIGGEK